MTGFTAFDYAVIILILLSTILAFMKGFTSVALSLAAWLGALMVTVLGFAPISPYVRDLLEPVELADIVTLGVLFIASLILFKTIATVVGNAVRSSFVGFLDRSLGALFGLVRGLVIVSVFYLGFAALLGNDQPDWVQEAKTRPLVAWGAAMVEGLAGQALGHETTEEPLDVLAESLNRTGQAARKSVEDIARKEISREAAQYSKEAQKKLDALIEEKSREKNEDDS